MSYRAASPLARPTMNASRMGLGVLRACPTVIRPLWFAAVGKAVEISHVSYGEFLCSILRILFFILVFRISVYRNVACISRICA